MKTNTADLNALAVPVCELKNEHCMPLIPKSVEAFAALKVSNP